MKPLRISREEYFERLSTPHDPPSPEMSNDVFLENEYDLVCTRVLSTLAKFGKMEEGAGGGDYFWDFGYTRSRGFGVEILNGKIVTDEFIFALQQALHQSNPRWEIHLGSSRFDFGIFISVAAVRYWTESEVLQQLDE